MSNKNDALIEQLQGKVNAKRAKLKAIKKFAPVTNCSIEMNGVRHNIQVMKIDELVQLLVKLHAYLKSAEELELTSLYTVSGFPVDAWITDLQARLSHLTRKDEERKLNAMEAKLKQLMSEDKKVELELSSIMEDLND